MRHALRVGALALGFLLGCSSDGADPGDGDETGGDEGDGDDGVEADEFAGRYQLTSTYDLSASPVVPDLAGDAVLILTGFSEDPAGTLIEILDEANVPILDQLLGAIPGAVRDQFEGWVNDYIFDRLFEGVPLTEQIATWTSDIAAIVTHFDMVTMFDLGAADDAGAAPANHMLAAVSFPWHGDVLLVDTPDLVDQITMARDVACNVALEAQDGQIDIGDHAFHLPLGNFAVTAFNMALQQTLGFGDLREALGAVVDCAGLAESVASRCLGPVCVGHRDEIEGFCDAGLDLIAERVESRIASIDFTELRLRTGDALLHDASQDGAVDRIDEGRWQADITVDGVQVPIEAPFAGDRTE